MSGGNSVTDADEDEGIAKQVDQIKRPGQPVRKAEFGATQTGYTVPRNCFSCSTCFLSSALICSKTACNSALA